MSCQALLEGFRVFRAVKSQEPFNQPQTLRTLSFKPRFPSSPLIIRVPFFLLFGSNKGTQKRKSVKGYYWGT